MKLNISDDQQPTFRIFPSEIGSFALGAPLSDQELYALCRKHGDPSGGLKFFVSPSPDRPPLHYDPGYNSGLAPASVSCHRLLFREIFTNRDVRPLLPETVQRDFKNGLGRPISVFDLCSSQGTPEHRAFYAVIKERAKV